jgi:hypothetical protein
VRSWRDPAEGANGRFLALSGRKTACCGRGRQDKGHRLEAIAFLRTIPGKPGLAYRVAAVLGARNAGIRSARTKRGAN